MPLATNQRKNGLGYKSLDLVFRPPVSPSPGSFAVGGKEEDSETGDDV